MRTSGCVQAFRVDVEVDDTCYGEEDADAELLQTAAARDAHDIQVEAYERPLEMETNHDAPLAWEAHYDVPCSVDVSVDNVAERQVAVADRGYEGSAASYVRDEVAEEDEVSGRREMEWEVDDTQMAVLHELGLIEEGEEVFWQNLPSDSSKLRPRPAWRTQRLFCPSSFFSCQ